MISVLDVNVDGAVATVTLEDEWRVMWSIDFETARWASGCVGWVFTESYVIDEDGVPHPLTAPDALIQEALSELEVWDQMQEMTA